jgi:hypothetical protein
MTSAASSMERRVFALVRDASRKNFKINWSERNDHRSFGTTIA